MKASLSFIILASLMQTVYCQSPKVEHYGALKNFMHKGDVSAKVDLKKYEGTKHFYGLGAIENLKGEILILDGSAYLSSVKNNQLTISTDFNKKASLFVASEVSKWTRSEIPEGVETYEELESFVELLAEESGIDVDKAFPFLLEGEFESINWHVIDWKEGDMEHTHDKHKNSGLNGQLENEQAIVLGFFSKHHTAIFTHHSTNMHLHVKNEQETICGHVDGLQLGKGMSISLPRVE